MQSKQFSSLTCPNSKWLKRVSIDLFNSSVSTKQYCRFWLLKDRDIDDHGTTGPRKFLRMAENMEGKIVNVESKKKSKESLKEDRHRKEKQKVRK